MLSPSFSLLRFFSIESLAVTYKTHGNPLDVLKLDTISLPDSTELKNDQVLINFLGMPINPADINMIQGNYPILPDLPAVGGNEGFGVVLGTGPKVEGLKKGDHVIPAQAGFGTWRTHAIAKPTQLHKIPKDIPAPYAATFSVNPCTAYRMLHDFVDLKPGDVVVQNGANGAVGQSVFQICKDLGVTTINVIRKRPDYDVVVERMKGYGADIVCHDEFFLSKEFGQLFNDLPKPKLALNCVGGESSTKMAKLLNKNGVMVTYGGMARKAVSINPGKQIFDNINLQGFWMSKWTQENSVDAREEMFQNIYRLIREDKLKLWLEMHDFKQFPEAFRRQFEPQRNRKVVLTTLSAED